MVVIILILPVNKACLISGMGQMLLNIPKRSQNMIHELHQVHSFVTFNPLLMK
jgi:hypothetical protein